MKLLPAMTVLPAPSQKTEIKLDTEATQIKFTLADVLHLDRLQVIAA